jgi:hypothetical protein
MTYHNVETLRKVVGKLSSLRLEVAVSDNDELDPVWNLLLETSIKLRTFVEQEGVQL